MIVQANSVLRGLKKKDTKAVKRGYVDMNLSLKLSVTVLVIVLCLVAAKGSELFESKPDLSPTGIGIVSQDIVSRRNLSNHTENHTAPVRTPDYVHRRLLVCPAGESEMSVYDPVSKSVSFSGICAVCPAGTFSATASEVACTSCPSGKYQNATGQTYCLTRQCDGQCEAGSWSSVISATCTLCAAGQYGSGAQTSSAYCTACDVGQVQVTAGMTYCDFCPAGQFNAETGMPACGSCPPGKYSSIGAAECPICAGGKFTPSGSAHQVCTACPAGKHSANVTASTSCIACATGQYCAAGVTSCSACTAGRMQPAVGQPSCDLCPTGQFQAAETSVVCDTCPSGKFQTDLGKAFCQDNPAGQKVEERQGQETTLTLRGLALSSFTDAVQLSLRQNIADKLSIDLSLVQLSAVAAVAATTAGVAGISFKVSVAPPEVTGAPTPAPTPVPAPGSSAGASSGSQVVTGGSFQSSGSSVGFTAAGGSGITAAGGSGIGGGSGSSASSGSTGLTAGDACMQVSCSFGCLDASGHCDSHSSGVWNIFSVGCWRTHTILPGRPNCLQFCRCDAVEWVTFFGLVCGWL